MNNENFVETRWIREFVYVCVCVRLMEVDNKLSNIGVRRTYKLPMGVGFAVGNAERWGNCTPFAISVTKHEIKWWLSLLGPVWFMFYVSYVTLPNKLVGVGRLICVPQIGIWISYSATPHPEHVLLKIWYLAFRGTRVPKTQFNPTTRPLACWSFIHYWIVFQSNG